MHNIHVQVWMDGDGVWCVCVGGKLANLIATRRDYQHVYVGPCPYYYCWLYYVAMVQASFSLSYTRHILMLSCDCVYSAPACFVMLFYAMLLV